MDSFPPSCHDVGVRSPRFMSGLPSQSVGSGVRYCILPLSHGALTSTIFTHGDSKRIFWTSSCVHALYSLSFHGSEEPARAIMLAKARARNVALRMKPPKEWIGDRNGRITSFPHLIGGL